MHVRATSWALYCSYSIRMHGAFRPLLTWVYILILLRKHVPIHDRVSVCLSHYTCFHTSYTHIRLTVQHKLAVGKKCGCSCYYIGILQFHLRRSAIRGCCYCCSMLDPAQELESILEPSQPPVRVHEISTRPMHTYSSRTNFLSFIPG